MITTKTRREWNLLAEADRREFIVSSGRIEDDPPPARPQVSDPEIFTRREFDKLTPAEQRAAALAGRRVVDGERAPPDEPLPSATETVLLEIRNLLKK